MRPRKTLIGVSVVGLVLALVSSVALAQDSAPQSPVGTAFTYQGRLEDASGPVSGTCDLRFTLFDAAVGGTQTGGTETFSDVVVGEGLFTVQLDFGAGAFNGQERWLEIEVRCPAGTGSYARLSARQELTPAPYALWAADAPDTLEGLSCGSRQVAKWTGGAWTCKDGNDHTHLGQEWSSWVTGLTIEGTYGDAMHLSAKETALDIGSARNGVRVRSAEDRAFYAEEITVGDGLHVDQAGDDGVHVRSAGTPSTMSISDAHNGLEVEGAQGNGVWIGRADGDGVYVKSAGNHGVRVIGTSHDGLHIWEPGRDGLRVWNAAADGVHVFQAGGYAGNFEGNVRVTGTLSKGGGSFTIDHPLDPENRYLQHSFVESPDMMSVYNGNVTLDADGTVWVTLPDWFEALNRDFRYQLTCIGGFAPVYIAHEIEGNRFQIAGGEPGLKVSWQVTGIRHDPFAEANRIVVEVDKPLDEQGTYLHPEAYGLPKARGLAHRQAQEELARQEAGDGGQP